MTKEQIAKKALRNILEYIGLPVEKWGNNAALITYIEGAIEEVSDD